jgi:hypothetical protein
MRSLGQNPRESESQDLIDEVDTGNDDAIELPGKPPMVWPNGPNKLLQSFLL